MSFDDLSLVELKSRMSNAADQISLMNRYRDSFKEGSRSFTQSGDDTSAATTQVNSGWSGPASDSATSAMGRMQGYMTDGASAADGSAYYMDDMSSDTHQQNQRTQSIKEVDTSFGTSMKRSGGNPFAAVVDNYEQHQKADANRRQAAVIASNMNQAGYNYADRMNSQSWPSAPPAIDGSKPGALPPPPSGTGARPGQSDTGGYSGPRGGGGGPTSVIGIAAGQGYQGGNNSPGGPKKNPGGQEELGTGGNGNGFTVPSTDGSGTSGATGATGVSGSGGAGTGSGVPGVNGGPGSTGAGGSGVAGGGAAAGLAGGGLAVGGIAGLSGRGGLGGRPGGLAGEGLRGGRPGAGALGEGEGGLRGGRPGAGALGEGEGGLRGGRPGAGALGEGEGLRPGGRGLAGEPGRGAPIEEPGRGLPREPMLRGGSSAFAAEEVAASRGGAGPMMGGGRGGRRDDDEEHAVPDYLVESDDYWAGEQTGSPSVIGE